MEWFDHDRTSSPPSSHVFATQPALRSLYYHNPPRSSSSWRHLLFNRSALTSSWRIYSDLPPPRLLLLVTMALFISQQHSPDKTSKDAFQPRLLAPLLIIVASLTSRQYHHDKTSKHTFESHGSTKFSNRTLRQAIHTAQRAINIVSNAINDINSHSVSAPFIPACRLSKERILYWIIYLSLSAHRPIDHLA